MAYVLYRTKMRKLILIQKMNGLMRLMVDGNKEEGRDVFDCGKMKRVGLWKLY